eukprot:TRINITY_DN424_c4_g1_i1.p1 TRINITY_DN424_c4_g1~~TRINITY_DN424_c4_g1_i1.p1  ORF type:complete len:930 (+),score=236.74 TRINITY_DN424_c4_g1_i1:37-2826(+)
MIRVLLRYKYWIVLLFLAFTIFNYVISPMFNSNSSYNNSVKYPDKTSQKRVVIVVGSGMELVNVATVIQELNNENVEVFTVFVGQSRDIVQNYLDTLSLSIQYDLIIGGTLSLQEYTQQSMSRLSQLFSRLQPDVVLVYGDGTSAVSASVVAFNQHIKVAHIDAGLRSQVDGHDQNQEIVDSFTDYFFTSTNIGCSNLVREKKAVAQSIFVTGNTEIDLVMKLKDSLSEPTTSMKSISQRLDLNNKSKKIILFAIQKTSDVYFMKKVIDIIGKINKEQGDGVSIIFPCKIDPLTRSKLPDINTINAVITDPLHYNNFLYLLSKVDIVVTDSVDVQLESSVLSKPTIVIESPIMKRPEGHSLGFVKFISGQDVATETVSFVSELIKNPNKLSQITKNPFGDGKAAERIVQVLVTGTTTQFGSMGRCDKDYKPLINPTPTSTSTSTMESNAPAEVTQISEFLPELDRIVLDYTEVEYEAFAQKSPDALTHSYISSIPNTVGLDDPVNSVAVIISCKQTHNIKQLIDSVTAQEGVFISDIYVVTYTTLGSSDAAALNQVLQAYAENKVVKPIYAHPSTIGSSHFIKIQEGLQLSSQFVVLMDDDTIIGKKFIKFFVKLANTRPFLGLYGTKGIIFPPEEDGDINPDKVQHITSGKSMQKVDVASGILFFHTSWLKVCFREKPFDIRGSEAFYASYLLSKYAGIPKYVIPTDESDPETGTKPSQPKVNDVDIPVGGVKFDLNNPQDMDLFKFSFSRGFDLLKKPSESHRPSVLFFVENAAQSKFISTWMSTNFGISYKVIALNATSETRTTISNDMKLKSHSKDNKFLNINVGYDFPRLIRPVDIASDVSYAITQIVSYYTPKMVVVPYGLSSTHNVAPSSVCVFSYYLGVPSGIILIDQTLDDQQQQQQFLSLISLGAIPLQSPEHLKSLVK